MLRSRGAFENEDFCKISSHVLTTQEASIIGRSQITCVINGNYILSDVHSKTKIVAQCTSIQETSIIVSDNVIPDVSGHCCTIDVINDTYPSMEGEGWEGGILTEILA